MHHYIKNGSEIYKTSFNIIRSEANLTHIDKDLEKIIVRIIHACGMIDIIEDFAYSVNAGNIGRNALKNGANIICDAKMVAHGITKSRLPNNNPIYCYLDDLHSINIAKTLNTTRSAAAVDLWIDKMQDSVILIGNAPTALFRLLELVEQGAPRPALIIGIPVGFVGAIESKIALAQNNLNLNYITIHGRRGGSAMAVAALNALAMENEI